MTERVAAAQYLRKSTGRQEYSLPFQRAAISSYAASHNFEIITTYSDTKSGLSLKHRTGLSQLLEDAISGLQPYKAILVYDVSRWGRFQDSDESAHYEFICRRAGVEVHYCAEPFSNGGTMPSVMMKAIKRVMAGLNPQGCVVHPFKVPTAEELDHAYLWRAVRRLPRRGDIGIFNRSYYEEVLVVRVHQELLKTQKLPPKLVTRKIWQERFADINAFERHVL